MDLIHGWIPRGPKGIPKAEGNPEFLVAVANYSALFLRVGGGRWEGEGGSGKEAGEVCKRMQNIQKLANVDKHRLTNVVPRFSWISIDSARLCPGFPGFP